MADMSPSLTSSGQCPHCGAYNFQKAIICVRCSQVINKLFMDTESEGISSPQTVYDDAISGNQRLFFKAARTCMTYQSANLLQNLKTTYFGTNPLTGQRRKLGDVEKGQILLAMSLIRLPETGTQIIEILKKDSWNAHNLILGVYATYALSIYQPEQSVIDYVVKEKAASIKPIERYICYEAAKKTNHPQTIRILLSGSEGDIQFLLREPSTPLFSGGIVGLALDLMNLSTLAKQQLDSAFTAILAISPSASPFQASIAYSPNIQYIWSLQRRIDTVEALTEKMGNNILGSILPSISNRLEKILAACVIQRRSPGHQSWLSPIVDAATVSSFGVTSHYKTIAIDTLLRLQDHISPDITSKAVTAGLSDSETYVKVITAMSIVLNRQTVFYQQVINLSTNPDSNVRLGSALAMYAMSLRHPDLKDNLRQLVAKMASSEQIEPWRSSFESLAQTWTETGEGTLHDEIISLL